MLKKISLAIAILLLGAFSIVWTKVIAPMQASADRFGPETAARDYALQDNSRIQIPAASTKTKRVTHRVALFLSANVRAEPWPLKTSSPAHPQTALA
jgi:hypothetical protein